MMPWLPEPARTLCRILLMLLMLSAVIICSHQNAARFVYGGF